MRNAEWLTGAKTLNEILKEGKVFRALGTLMYSRIEDLKESLSGNVNEVINLILLFEKFIIIILLGMLYG